LKPTDDPTAHRDSEESLTSGGQRHINVMWEGTQRLIALGVMATFLTGGTMKPFHEVARDLARASDGFVTTFAMSLPFGSGRRHYCEEAAHRNEAKQRDPERFEAARRLSETSLYSMDEAWDRVAPRNGLP